MLLNLLINAVHAIETEREGKELGQIRIESRRHEGMGEIIMTDSGCGIEPALVEKIFDPFFTTKDVGHGSGQGLAIAYNIVTENHGGALLVESEPGRGSRFIVRLPLFEEE